MRPRSDEGAYLGYVTEEAPPGSWWFAPARRSKSLWRGTRRLAVRPWPTQLIPTLTGHGGDGRGGGKGRGNRDGDGLRGRGP